MKLVKYYSCWRSKTCECKQNPLRDKRSYHQHYHFHTTRMQHTHYQCYDNNLYFSSQRLFLMCVMLFLCLCLCVYECDHGYVSISLHMCVCLYACVCECVYVHLRLYTPRLRVRVSVCVCACTHALCHALQMHVCIRESDKWWRHGPVL